MWQLHPWYSLCPEADKMVKWKTVLLFKPASPGISGLSTFSRSLVGQLLSKLNFVLQYPTQLVTTKLYYQRSALTLSYSSSLGTFSIFQVITDEFCQGLHHYITWDGMFPALHNRFLIICCLIIKPQSHILDLRDGSTPLLLTISVLPSYCYNNAA